MKKELLEHLVRHCVREVLSQVKEADDTKGAASPPSGGLGTADVPAIPNKPEDPVEPNIPTTPKEPEVPQPKLKGILFIDPKDKSKREKIQLKSHDDASIERELHKLARRHDGPHTKVALSAIRLSKEAVKNPSSKVFLYLGKYDPMSDEVFLMGDKSEQVAKDNSVPSSVVHTHSGEHQGSEFNPTTAGAGEFAQQIQQQGRTPVHGVDEQFKKIIKKVVSEILNK